MSKPKEWKSGRDVKRAEAWQSASMYAETWAEHYAETILEQPYPHHETADDQQEIRHAE